MKKKIIKAAAVQMDAKIGDISYNLQKADILTEEAFKKGAEVVILPEFFPTCVGFHPSMIDAALPFKGKAFNFLISKAKKHRGIVGGSFISIKNDNERYNTFILAMPDGSFRFHDKDLPTMWENCYYIPGKDDGIADTHIGSMGIAMCWELVRSQTLHRLQNKIELLVSGSCWWDIPYKNFPFPFKNRISRGNKKIMYEAPSRMAKMLGVPVIHAGHTGKLECKFPMLPGMTFHSYLLGETQIVDASGNILKRMKGEEGDGVICADLEIVKQTPLEKIPDRYWIYRFHPLIKFSWYYQNLHGKLYYRRVIKKNI